MKDNNLGWISFQLIYLIDSYFLLCEKIVLDFELNIKFKSLFLLRRSEKKYEK